MKNLVSIICSLIILSGSVGCNGSTKTNRDLDENFKKSLNNKSDDELKKVASDLYDNNDNSKAIVAFQICIERSLILDTSYFKQGVSLISSGEANAGMEKLEKAVKINPQYFKACFNIGAAAYDNKQYDKSIEYYKKAVEILPKDDASYYGLAASQYALGQFNDATENCMTALKLNPQNEFAKDLQVRLKSRTN